MKVTITITDLAQGLTNVSTTIDPPLTEDTEVTEALEASQVALRAIMGRARGEEPAPELGRIDWADEEYSGDPN